MPAEQSGEAYRLGKGRHGLRYRDNDGIRRRTREKFASRTAALNHYRDVIAPMLRGERPVVDDTLAAFVETYLERHAPTCARRPSKASATACVARWAPSATSRYPNSST
jgi:hypothetical protein